jgi:hypothetical protein
MKQIKLFMTGMLIILATMGQMSCSSPKTTAQNNEKSEMVKKQIESRFYKIAVDQVSPMQAPSRHVNGYSLSIRGDTVASYLPYHGEAYSVPYGGGRGLIFKALISDYKLTFNKKGTASIVLRTRTEDGTYRYSIEIFNNGSSSIRVIPDNRQSISFYGQLEEDK